MALVSPRVQPRRFDRGADGVIAVTVRQSVRDLAGRPLQDRAQQLQDKQVVHVFQLRQGRIERFDIREV